MNEELIGLEKAVWSRDHDAAVIRLHRVVRHLTGNKPVVLDPKAKESRSGERAIICSRVAGAIAEVERELGSQGRVVLRASGTEPVVRVMVEGRDAGQVERLARSLVHSVQRAAEEAA